jgi:hypothetical protein
MRTKQLVAGAAIVGGAGLVVVGLGPMVVTADASPPIVSNEPDPSGPTFTIEPAPSAPSSDITSDTGIATSTDTGSGMPDGPSPDPAVAAPSDLPPVLDVPNGAPPIESTTGPADSSAPKAAGAPPNPTPGDPTGLPADLGRGCRPLWCPRPPDGPNQPPTWPWNDPLWPDPSNSWDSTSILPSPCVLPPQRDAPPPPPLQYGGQTVSPAFDDGLQRWGFWYFRNWVPLFGAECQMPAHTGTAEPHT